MQAYQEDEIMMQLWVNLLGNFQEILGDFRIFEGGLGFFQDFPNRMELVFHTEIV